jgi:general secretion pathway protein L
VLLLPAPDVALAEPELPLRGGARLAQAVPFALEEQLASEVETMHFAVGARSAGAAGTPVAFVARNLMDRWQGACEAAGIHPDAAYADTMAVPSPWSVHHAARRGHAVRASAVQCLRHRRESARGRLGSRSATPRGGRNVVFLRALPSTKRTATPSRAAFPHRHAAGEIAAGRCAAVAAAQVASEAGVNLLQGPYAARSSMSAAASGASATCGDDGDGVPCQPGLVHLEARQAEKKLDAEIAAVFSAAMPGQKAVDPRGQMQGVLGSRGAAGGALLPAVAALAAAIAQAPQAKVESMSFRGDALELRLTAPTVEALDSIKQAMSQGGLSAELQSATPRGQTVEGRLQVRLGKA